MSTERENWSTILSSYQESSQWLESLISDPLGKNYLIPKTPETIKLTGEEKLLRTEGFLDYLGNPEKSYPSIHVTGTSGKGSVCEYASNLLVQVHPSVGKYTNPYVQIPNEKIAISGKLISPSHFARYVNAFRILYDNYKPITDFESKLKYAEAWTCLAHFIFDQEKVNWTVIECGVGGRYDSTNIINTAVSIINSVGYDHTFELGSSLHDIAWHKSGIIKPHKPVVVGVIEPDILKVIKEEAYKNNSPLFQLNKDFGYDIVSNNNREVVADFFTPFGTYKKVSIGLQGNYQAHNAVVALTAVQLALQLENNSLNDGDIRNAMKATNLIGRFETMQTDPLVVLDGAHNEAKLSALADLLNSNYSNYEITLIIGMLKNKNILDSLSPILPLAKKVIATEPTVKGKPVLPSKEMREIVSELAPNAQVKSIPNVKDAIDSALISSGKQGNMIVITGSLYMLGQAREYWYPKETVLEDLEYSKN